MNVSTAIQERRAEKMFDPAFTISEQQVTDLLVKAMLSPTAFNIQNWRIVNVKDPALRQRIREVAWNQDKVTDATLLFVLCADLNAWAKEPARYWAGAPQMYQDMLIPAIDAYYRDKPQVQRDEAMRSCGLLAMSIMLLAQEQGWHSCPIDGFDFDAVGKLINLPDDHVVSLMIAVGSRAQESFPRTGKLSLAEVLVENSF
ncbi:NAD(P)H nitroreductase [Geotalea uraniireducens]|uniref:NAD(P)H nitroreductase n=1 Tax=Geotalea uraniireducens TaxID=351604 RepID=A0ABN6VWJ0_9BACT|nr:nitroreductase family protein [Geotalea uraniireducens]BDV42627.1 NAD(P)H nitroreductase [Geotalea uraniireducens]